MRQIYNCIGAYFDLSTVSLIRFDLISGEFNVLGSKLLSEPSNYKKISSAIEALCLIEPIECAPTVDVLSNFSANLTGQLQALSVSGWNMRFKTIENEDTTRDDALMCLLNLVATKRLKVVDSDLHVKAILTRLASIDRKSLSKNFDGNEKLSNTLEAILHSIVWLDGQLAKFKINHVKNDTVNKAADTTVLLQDV